ncbi:MAG: hypothetical protein D3910_28240 [Candidatus Electrothrix sp. ATG2]|nr:hypothetical protein [Candidatus Electrothrix sp. ATG2]
MRIFLLIILAAPVLLLLAGCPATMPQQTQADIAKFKIETLSKYTNGDPETAKFAVMGIIGANTNSPVIYNNVVTGTGTGDRRNKAQADININEDGQCQIPPSTLEEEFWPVSGDTK